MGHNTATQHSLLALETCDEIINKAARLQHGNSAVEDCEISDNAIAYFLENGKVGTVCRMTGAVTFTEVQQ